MGSVSPSFASLLAAHLEAPANELNRKEAFDAAIAFFTAYRERSRPAETNAMFHVLDKHNHLS